MSNVFLGSACQVAQDYSPQWKVTAREIHDSPTHCLRTISILWLSKFNSKQKWQSWDQRGWIDWIPLGGLWKGWRCISTSPRSLCAESLWVFDQGFGRLTSSIAEVSCYRNKDRTEILKINLLRGVKKSFNHLLNTSSWDTSVNLALRVRYSLRPTLRLFKQYLIWSPAETCRERF